MPAPSDAAAAAVHVADRPDAPGEPPSTTTSSSDLTVLEADRSSTRSRTLTLEAPHDDATPAPSKGDTGPVKTTGLFREPGTMPLPDHGERALGVVFEGVTVYGAGGTRRTVEGLEKAVFKVRLLSCSRPVPLPSRRTNLCDGHAHRCGTSRAS